MNLLLIPILLFAGATLVYMGVNGTPQLQLQGLPRFYTRHLMHPHFMGAVKGRPAHTTAIVGVSNIPTITQSDVLLADVLTEMLDIKTQFAELQAQFAKFSAEVHQLSQDKPAPARRTRRVA